MVEGLLQSCGFVTLDGFGVDGLVINVFIEDGDPTARLESLSSSYPNGADVPGIGDAAFIDDQPRGHVLWAVQGRIQVVISVSPGLDPWTVEQFKVLAEAAFGRL